MPMTSFRTSRGAVPAGEIREAGFRQNVSVGTKQIVPCTGWGSSPLQPHGGWGATPGSRDRRCGPLSAPSTPHTSRASQLRAGTTRSPTTTTSLLSGIVFMRTLPVDHLLRMWSTSASGGPAARVSWRRPPSRRYTRLPRHSQSRIPTCLSRGRDRRPR
jgi:hypothetical protein